MMNRASVTDGKAWRQGLALWLLLLSILTHAVVPAGSPLQRGAGAAFSAAGAEVAIAPDRRTPGAGRAGLTVAEEGSPEGAGVGDDPQSPVASGRFQGLSAAHEAKVAGPPPTRPARGGAAPFSARAPPSI